MRYRYESFGGIVASDEPPFLAFVDRGYMRGLGLPTSPLWDTPDDGIGALCAPVEVHFACTNQCSLGCAHCYMTSGVEEANVLDTAAFKKSLEALARLGVFHVALGGGEALERKDLFELAAHARALGLVPNLTTNGQLVRPAVVDRLRLFGQVNVSLDGVGETARTFRDGASFDDADRALGLLLKTGIAAGINCVIGRRTFEGLPELYEYAAHRGIAELELLRFKPSGRGRALYARHCTTAAQNRALFPRIGELSGQHGVKTKIDCSFVPMLCYHRPPRELLEAYCVCGCEAGNFLVGARADGRVCGCSFLPALDTTVDELEAAWTADPQLRRYRNWEQTADEPCASCDYLDICKGGCHAVALAVTGCIDAPDPHCPWVWEAADAENAHAPVAEARAGDRGGV